MKTLLVAIGCLTIVPVGPNRSWSDQECRRSLLWFPLVGLLIGLVLAGAYSIGSAVYRYSPAVAGIVVIVWVVLTGAIHLDGLADTCDGLYGGHTPQQRLRIMKDPHVGAMAVVAIVCVLLLKYSLLNSLADRKIIHALLLAPCLARTVIVVLATTVSYARPEGGTAAAFVHLPNRTALIGAGAFALLVAWGTYSWKGLLVFGGLVVGSLILRMCFARALGGVTGDALGASAELSEVCVLAALAIAGN